ncbi:hypothetical protein CUT44_14305 [Streptomyces carminius]|uniref:ESX-1 secretion-associated protein n=1 Tax=Streptomyces carminius TaxID=2665496 RepID=A0A2M8LYZ9_9ACTN|nr:hypothetical protein [Streptomyces carminius]PJE97149.1 hypothetical protein CUT44_14305 [Streptomyces carminius]
MDLARIGDKVADTLSDGVTFTVVVARLAFASASMLSLSEAVCGAYNYIEGCAKSVDHLADTAAGLNVDPAVTSVHHDAAAVMRGVLADAEALATEAAEMASDFQTAQEEHEADYGPVHEAMTAKPGAVADRTYYSNR